MNTAMWEHPLTSKQVHILTADLQATVIDPVTKLLACGDMGKGAMADVDDIVAIVRRLGADSSA